MEVNIVGPIYDASGFANVNRQIARQLDAFGVNIKITAQSWGRAIPRLPTSQQKLLQEMENNFTVQAGTVIYSGLPLLFKPESNRITVGLTMSESSKIINEWVEKCNVLDNVWVPSTFNYHSFAAGGVDAQRLRVMPLGVDADIFVPEGPRFNKLPQDEFIFFTNIEWVARKGYDILLKAFLEEFSAQEDVRLVIKAYNNSAESNKNGAEAIAYELQSLCYIKGISNAKITLITDILTDGELAALYRAAHCYILPTRGEGWNLTALEAMASGLPVITTDWSAHLDFVDNDVGYLIKVDTTEPVPEQGTNNDQVYKGAFWARPSVASTRELMRYVFETGDEAKRKGRAGRERVEQLYTWQSAGKRIYHALCEISATSGKTKYMNKTSWRNKTGGHCVGVVLPSINQRSGIACYTKELALAIKEQDYAVEMFTHSPIQLPEWCRQKQISIVHFQVEYGMYDVNKLEWALIALTKAGIYKIATMHSFYRDAVEYNRTLKGGIDHFIVHSRLVKEELISIGINENKISVLAMGCKGYQLPVRDKLKQECQTMGKPAIGFAGFMAPHKGLLELGLAVKELKKLYPQLQCHLFAAKSDNQATKFFYKKMLNFYRRHSLWKGMQPNFMFYKEEELVKRLATMDVNILPYAEYIAKGTSAAVRLLMSAQRPVIVTDTSFFSDLTTGEVFKIANESPANIAQGVKTILSDQTLAKDLVQKSTEYVHNNLWPKIALQHIKIYQQEGAIL